MPSVHVCVQVPVHVYHTYLLGEVPVLQTRTDTCREGAREVVCTFFQTRHTLDDYSLLHSIVVLYVFFLFTVHLHVQKK